MKRILIILLGFIVSLTVMGQEVQSEQQRFEKYDRISKFDANNGDNTVERQWFSTVKNTQFDVLKSSQAIKQRLDSEVWHVCFDSTNQLVPYEKHEYIWDVNGNLTKDISNFWYENISQWVAYKKFEYTYNANGNLTLTIRYHRDNSTSPWIGALKIDDTYDVNGNLIHTIFYDWDESISQWVPYWKFEFNYDANSNLTQEIIYDWNESTSQWVTTSKYEPTYDANGNLIQAIIYDWDESISLWVNLMKWEYIYDANSNLTQGIRYQWDENTIQWVNSNKYENTYDVNGNLTDYNSFNWNGSQWVGSNKIEYTHDVNGDLTQGIHFDWDVINSLWVPWGKDECTYDISYSFDELLLPFTIIEDDEDILYFNHKLTEILSYEWDESVNQWIVSSKGTYFYSEQNVPGISNSIALDIDIYPNPTQEYVVFDVEAIAKSTIVKIYDFQGKKVLEQDIYNNKQVSVSHLASGLYFYKFTQFDKAYGGKLIIK